MSTLTQNEVTALRAIVGSEYQCGEEEADVVGYRVWTIYCNPFSSARTFSGVVSSLSQKGFVKCSAGDTRKEDTIAITKAGWDALNHFSGLTFAVVRRERLSDNSVAYNVTFEAGDNRVTIGATSSKGAEAIAAAINEHAAWIE